MRRAATRWTVAASVIVTGISAWGQTTVPPSTPPASPSSIVPASPSKPADAIAGGRLHGVVKSGNIPLPGVTVTAQNTLTGKRYSTTSDITGAWSLIIPQNGRYVIRTQFAAFAAGGQEALLNASNHDQTVNFELMLASRAAAQEQQQQGDRFAGGASVATACGQRSAKLESGKRVGFGYRHAERRCRNKRRITALHRRQPGLQRRFCGDQRSSGRSKSVGRRGHGSIARCNGDNARTKWRARR